MIDILVRAAVAAVAAVAAYLVANEAVKVISGKDIPTHLYAWWSRIRDRVIAWKNANPQLRAARILAEVVLVGEKYVARLKRMAQMVKLNVFAVPEGETRKVEVAEEEVVLEELGQQLPGAAPGDTLDLTDAA